MAQTIECGRVCRVYADDIGIAGTAAGNVKPITDRRRKAGAETVSLRLQNPSNVVRRPRKRQVAAADAERDIGRIWSDGLRDDSQYAAGWIETVGQPGSR